MRTILVFFFVNILSACSVLALLVWLHKAVDPYFIFGNKLIPGLNAEKPFLVSNSRVAKPQIVSRLKPQVVYLGASTIEAGLDPDFMFSNSNPSSIFNLGISGGQFYEIYRMFQHATTIETVNKIIIGIDFSFWTSDNKKYRPGFREMHLAVDKNYLPQKDWQNLLLWTLARQRIGDGLLTLHYQDLRYISKDGFPLHWLKLNGARTEDSSEIRVAADLLAATET